MKTPTVRHLLSLLIVSISAVAQADIPDRIDASTPHDVQIRIAEAAAPKQVSSAATILVLGKNGYEVARVGTNGFTCLINRERPDTMEPECYDAEGSVTTLKVTRFVEAQRAKGISEEEIEK